MNNDMSSKSMDGECDLIERFSGFSGSGAIHLNSFAGVDYSKLAFLFCGQGQMAPGLMKDFVQLNPIFRARFQELDEIAASFGVPFRPSDYILAEEHVSKAHYSLGSTLALFTLQISMFENLLVEGFFPKLLSAHSFGEFTQLVASGCVRFRDMISFLIHREKCLGSFSGSYTMFAVSNFSKMSQLVLPCEAHLANINTHSQATYVCKKTDYSVIKKFLRSEKIACIELYVDSPFHTPWLIDVKNQLSEYVKEANWVVSPPKIPFVSSVVGQLISVESYKKEDILDFLSEQLVQKVNFPNQLEIIYANNCANFIELSPIDVLTPFVEQSLTAKKVKYKVSSFRKKVPQIEKRGVGKQTFKNSKVLQVFNKALKTLTGYSVETIHLEDKIREDLGIDSIKKAEIVFEMIEQIESGSENKGAPLNLAELSTFGDILDYFERSISAQNNHLHSIEKKNSDFSAVCKGFAPTPLLDYSSYLNQVNIQVCNIEDLRLNVDKIKSGDLLVLKSFSALKEKELTHELLYWIQYFQANTETFDRFIFHHNGGVLNDLLCPFFASYAQEKEISFKSIQGHESLDHHDYYKESIDFYNKEVIYGSDGIRTTRCFSEVKFSGVHYQPKQILAFGGSGGVGRLLLQSLMQHKPSLIYIVGRRSAEDVDLSFLDAVNVDIRYAQCDVSDKEQVKGLIEHLTQKCGFFDLILHCVGVEFSKLLVDVDKSDVEETLNSKMVLANELEVWAKKNNTSRVVFCSSLAAEFANRGQAPYGVANRYLNSVADRSNNIVSIVWPAWENVGMAKNPFIAKSLKLQGTPLMSPSKGQELFVKCLQQKSGTYHILNPSFMPEYYAVSQVALDIKGLYENASKDRSMAVLSGLTQKRLPYLMDHLIKRACLLPASGSISLMLLRAYQEFGHLGDVVNFRAHNFLIVGEEQKNYFLFLKIDDDKKMKFQIRSQQMIAEAEVDIKKNVIEKTKPFEFEADLFLQSHFDQDSAIYIGPDFKLDQGLYYSSQAKLLLLEMDLNKSPQYTGVPILDKLHKLLEASFSVSCARARLDYELAMLPKSFDKLCFYKDHLEGHCFYPVVGEIERNKIGGVCSVKVYNSYGNLALSIKNFHMVAVGEKKKEYTQEKCKTPFLFPKKVVLNSSKV